MQVVLPGEADAAVDLERGARDAASGVTRVGLRAGDGERCHLRLEVERPRRPVHGRAGALDLQQHLRARVRDGLVGADRAIELAALLGVGDGHLHRPLGDADRLGRVHHGRLAARALDVEVAGRRLAVAARDPEQPPRRVERAHRLDLRAGDHGAVPVDQHVGGAGVGAQPVDHDRAAAPVADVGAQQPGGPRRLQRRRRERVAELLGDHDHLDRAELGDLRPSELDHLAPLRVGEAALVVERQAPDLGQREARGEQLARGGLDRPLVVGEVEVHPTREARGRARRRCSGGSRWCRPRSSSRGRAGTGTSRRRRRAGRAGRRRPSPAR